MCGKILAQKSIFLHGFARQTRRNICIWKNKFTEHNIFICELALTGENINDDLYEGSQVDITIKVDEFRTVNLEAYIPIPDKSFNVIATIYDKDLSIEEIQNTVNNKVGKTEEI